jgi:uncharacterized protein (TIGR02677 family)
MRGPSQHLPDMPEHLQAEARALLVFSHLNAEKSALYRVVLRVFMEAKAAFALHLRPSDVRAGLGTGSPLDEGDAGALDAALSKLCEWGNLEAHRDIADVATVEEFYRPRFVYQLTAEGEAAERALALFYEALAQPGELQTAALADIRQYLAELARLSEADLLDEAVTHRVLHSLSSRFEQLTARAQTFLRGLQRTIDLHGITIEAFLEYKQTLIDYLERFIGELVIATHEIATTLRSIEKSGTDRLLEAAAQRDAIDAIDPDRPGRLAEARKLWHARWAGLRGWFISDRNRPSQADILRSRARSAVPALLSAVARINDRRITRSDRVADLQTLARWFAEAPSEADAHRLWRAAFGLAPARHLRVDEETLEEREQRVVPPQTSWLQAEPLRISPRVRQTGRQIARGSVRSVIDRTKEKELLAALARDETHQLAVAQSRLANGRRIRLSELGGLTTAAELELFLDLLGEALAVKMRPEEIVVAHSSDGTLRIELEPAGDGTEAVITTVEGLFRGEDHYLTISSAFGEAIEDQRDPLDAHES